MDIADKIVYFQAITGVDDPDLCAEILAAHGWDLELAVASFTGTGSDTGGPSATVEEVGVSSQSNESAVRTAVAPGLVWKLVTLPISVISGGLGLISGAVGFGFWAVGGVLSYSLNIFGFPGSRVEDSTSSSPLVSVSATARESADFVSGFERDFGLIRPNFVAEGFMDALQRSSRSFKLLFVYLHSPEHPDSQLFCQRTLCSELVSDFVNVNFVAWGGSIRGSEGFKMSNSLKASRFPFCAVVMAATNQRIAILQQVDGGRSEEEMLTLLQKAVEESGHILSAARLEAEERRNNSRLRDEQDAAYQASLEADRARDRRRREEHEKRERETAEADRKKKEEEEARETAARDAARKEAARVLTRQQKAVCLGPEPPKGPDVTQVVLRFPNGERRERRFGKGSTLQCVYDYVDTTECLKDGDEEEYCLVSNFPRVVYGRDKALVPLLEAGLHPQASLFVELNSSSF